MSSPPCRRVACRRRAFAEVLEPRRLLSAGALDTSFGSGGELFAGLFPSGSAICNAIARGPDGAIVLAGELHVGDNTHVALARFRSNGAIDRSFGRGGIVTTRFAHGAFDEYYAAAVQPDGKILVAGSSWTAGLQLRLLVVRYLPSGRLDSGFATGGIFETSALPLPEARAMAILPDGKILLEGTAIVGNGPAFSLCRLTRAGKLDGTFGNGGSIVTPIPGQDSTGDKVLLDRQGRIVVGDAEGLLARYSSDGVLDKTFGTAGLVHLYGGGGFGPMTADPDGGLIFPAQGAVVKLTASGAPDSKFGIGGTAAISNQPNLLEYGAILQKDGKIIAVGTAPSNSDPRTNNLIVARLLPSGKLDPTFGASGVERTPSTFDPADPANASAPVPLLQPDGKLVVALRNFVIRRFTNSGSLDESFAYHGQAMNPWGISGPVNAMLVQQDGKILVAGSETAPAEGLPTAAAVARYNPDGTLDRTFATNGVELVQIGDHAAFTSIKIAHNSDIVLGGYGESGSADVFAVVRLYNNGYRNRTFGVGGIELTSFGDLDGQRCNSITLQANGDIIAAGSTLDHRGTALRMAVVRYLPNGALDWSFGVGGLKTFQPGGKASAANSVALQSDGRIVLAGSVGDNFGLLRLRRNGMLDTSFGKAGAVSTQMNDGFTDVRSQATVARLDRAGDILLAGSVDNGVGQPPYGGAFARYLPDGKLDTAFGNRGIAVFDTTSNTNIEEVGSLLVQPDGQIVAGGVDSARASMVLRLTANGLIDSTFGTNGVVELSPEPEGASPPEPPPMPYPPVTALAIQSDGKILAAAGSDLFRLLGK